MRWRRFFAFFFLGAASTALVLASAAYLAFSFTFRDKVYPGVITPAPHDYSQVVLTFSSPAGTVSATGKDLELAADTQLMQSRALSIGRQTTNPYYNLQQIIAAWQGHIVLPLEVKLDEAALNKLADKLAPKLEKAPVDAVFSFKAGAGPDKKGRVETFSPSQNGLSINRDKLKEEIISHAKVGGGWFFSIPIDTVAPALKSSTADTLGIKNLLGEGISYFYDSIPGRVYNIDLGAGKITGSLIKPGYIFSFDSAIGTVSAVFGFAKAYSIVQGKTVLDDGGGVCQVSTTLYRAVLNSGLPVIERVAHTYRVSYYEQGGFRPGLDATVYPPNPDFRFKNDTGGWLLLQATFDPVAEKLTFDIFGTDDGRKTVIGGPYITATSPPPPPVYEDDPTKPLGTITQVDTAHPGAEVYFTRQVTRGSETLINETVKSSYIPWPARYLRGTKTP
ncbi:MAG: VanW family protein [Patescibacteria group bacterium]|nr:VanW family protein [Patescibacteria group bacterium]MCL5431966.1 VanW family protein [Patescibacteria group bacterium]